MSQRKIALVTGASQGIGHAIAAKFHAEDWEVLTLSRRPHEPAPWAPDDSRHVQFDLADAEHIDDAIAEVRHILAGRPLHALVNRRNRRHRAFPVLRRCVVHHRDRDAGKRRSTPLVP